MRHVLGVAVMLLGSLGVLQAQANSNGAASATVSPAKSMDALLNMIESEAMSAAKAMPADKYNFAPSQAIFASGQTTKYEGVRTFGQEVLHMAQANYGLYSSAGSMKPPVDVKALSSLKTKDEIVAALADSFQFAHRAIGSLTPQNAFEAAQGPGGTRISAAAFGVAHGFDHYGQMVEYLRMNGIVPPASQK